MRGLIVKNLKTVIEVAKVFGFSMAISFAFSGHKTCLAFMKAKGVF